MKKNIYKISVTNSTTKQNDIKEFLVGLIVYACVLMIVQAIFKGIYVKNFFFALIASLILSALNYYVKPFIVFLTLPLTIVSCGIAYPIVNVIILKICDLLMGDAFNTGGIIITFIIALVISGLKIFLDSMITKKIRR